MSFVGRGGKPLYHRGPVSMPTNPPDAQIGREAREFQQICRTGVSETADDFSPPRFSSALPIVNGVLRSLNVGTSGIAWRGEERRWQCRLASGPCTGLLIDACKTATGVIHITLTPPNVTIHQQLLEVLTDIKQKLAVFGDIDIKVMHGLSE
jgi:hypothetical protein